MERDAIIDDGQLTFLGVPDERFEHARQAVDEQLRRLQIADGRIQAPLSVQIFTASS